MQNEAECGKMLTKDDFLLCPKCRRRTDQKVLPTTAAVDLPVYCKKCKQSTVVNIKSLCHRA